MLLAKDCWRNSSYQQPFTPNQAWIKFSTVQRVKEVLCDIAPMDSNLW